MLEFWQVFYYVLFMLGGIALFGMGFFVGKEYQKSKDLNIFDRIVGRN